MSRNQIVTEKSELFDAICYIKGCSNIAVTSARLGVNEKLDIVIPVCEFCLPKISKESSKKQIQMKTQSDVKGDNDF